MNSQSLGQRMRPVQSEASFRSSNGDARQLPPSCGGRLAPLPSGSSTSDVALGSVNSGDVHRDQSQDVYIDASGLEGRCLRSVNQIVLFYSDLIETFPCQSPPETLSSDGAMSLLA